MSSWLARTISTTLDLDDPQKQDQNDVEPQSQTTDGDDVSSPNRGVKEDLSELTNTLSKQFWGVASFLAPSPSLSSGSDPHPEGSDPEIIPGIRSDFAEIGGRFRTGISKLSDNVASVSEITKMASTFLQLGSEEEEENQGYDGVLGVTDVVVAFVDDITMHPDTWLDFPLPDNEEDDQDFVLSNAQQEHALAVERLVPRLAALRMELCPGYMSESRFWKIYFILLHPRLDQHDAEVLSTSQIVEARALLTHNIKKATNVNPEQDQSSRDAFYVKDLTNSQEEEVFSVPSTAELQSVSIETSASELVDVPVAAAPETEKHPIISSEIQIVDKSVIEEDNVKQKKDKNSNSTSASKIAESIDEDDADDWLKEESQSTELVGSKGTKIPIVDDDDVSFSDLEEDEEDVPKVAKK